MPAKCLFLFVFMPEMFNKIKKLASSHCTIRMVTLAGDELLVSLVGVASSYVYTLNVYVYINCINNTLGIVLAYYLRLD